MTVRQKFNDKLVKVLDENRIQIVEPHAQMLQLNGVLAGPQFTKPRTNMLVCDRGGSTWEVFVDEDFYYVGADPERRRLFCGAKQSRWLALAPEEPVIGNLDRAVLCGLEFIDSPLQDAWRKYGELREEHLSPNRTALKRLETFGRVLSLPQLKTPIIHPTPGQKDRVACVVETVCRNRSPTCPLILGGAGSGKSTIARLAAARLLELGVERRVLLVHGAAVCAGMIFPPQRDERLGKAFEAALHAGDVLVVLEQFDLALGQSRVAASLAADALDAGLKMIVMADEAGWMEGGSQCDELYRRVQPILPHSLPMEEIGMILKGRFDEHPFGEKVEPAPELLTTVIKQSHWMPGDNPGAALGLLEAVLARAALDGRKLVGPDDVYDAVDVYGVNEE
ncbi:MAG: hypothetical protein KY475_12575 [Planctomycetes bacterium]|nr:hypothetical protein [Planctomycetota bacterium]